MPLKYALYWYVRCDQEDCFVETETMSEARSSTDLAEDNGWTTPDGLTWYCPAHNFLNA